MAAGDITGDLPELSPEENNEWVSQLKLLEPPQISELFDGFCSHCHSLLKSRLLSLVHRKNAQKSGKLLSETSAESSPANSNQQHSNDERTSSTKESSYSVSQERNPRNLSPSPVNDTPPMRDLFNPKFLSPHEKNLGHSVTISDGSSDEEAEWRRFSQVGRKKNFVHYEKVSGKEVNVLQGLELHTGTFSAEEQKKIVNSVYNFQKMGRKGQLMERTYSEPKKWMRGKGRVTIQFGCCYNYAMDKDGNPPGIIRDEEVDPLPPVFKEMIRRMVRWHILPPTCAPNSCIVNIYDEGDCIPPHIDHHDFLRPFCTVSFLAECNIMFGLNLKVSGPGEFSGPVSIPLPVGSVLVLKGNGADVAKHCVPAVPAKRISVTFRRMDESKIPYRFTPDPELLNLQPLVRTSTTAKAVQHPSHQSKINSQNANKKTAAIARVDNNNNSSFSLQNDDFPPLGGLRLGTR